MLKILYACKLSWSTSSHFVAIQCWNMRCIQKLRKNSLKSSLFRGWRGGVQGRLRSSMLINLKSLSPVLVMINSMPVPICHRFHTIRANNGNITSFRGYPSLTPSFVGNPTPRGTKFCHEKLETLTQPMVNVSRSYLALFWHNTAVWQTDRQTPRPWLRRANLSILLSRVKS